MKKQSNNKFIIVIIVLSLLSYFIFYKDQYTGYCKIEGTYRNRYVRCYGNYSPKVKAMAEKKARHCNQSLEPVGVCTSTYR